MTANELNLEAIAALADALIPPADGFLSGSEAGVPGKALDDAIVARPDLVPDLEQAATEVAAGTPAEALLQAWFRGRPEAFDRLFLLIRGAYFLNPAVCEALHYDGATAYPLSDAIEPDYQDLVAEVIAKGPRYRPVP
jgi:hypothetical protein